MGYLLNWAENKKISCNGDWQIFYYAKVIVDESLPITCKSVSLAVKKSTECLTDFAIQIRMSNVSTMGWRKYSCIASSCNVVKLTPWNDFWYLQEIAARKKNHHLNRCGLNIEGAAHQDGTRNWQKCALTKNSIYYTVPCIKPHLKTEPHANHLQWETFDRPASTISAHVNMFPASAHCTAYIPSAPI